MPIGYGIFVAYLAFCTATAVIGPRPAHSTRIYWGFWATFMLNELPFLALYTLAGSSILAFVQGDLASLGGLVAFAVAVLVTRLREVSTQPVVYAELPGAQHTFDLFYSLRYSQIIEAVTAFGAWLHTAQPHDDRPAA